MRNSNLRHFVLTLVEGEIAHFGEYLMHRKGKYVVIKLYPVWYIFFRKMLI